MIDEAIAAALAGDRSTLDTVVYTCCDMLNACELASDIERAAQWCQVADDFVARFGCPFLYAEGRIYYGSVLTAKGRWHDAERELGAGARLTKGACPGLHRRAIARLAELRMRQGRLEQAEQLLVELGEGIEAEAEAILLTAALALARGDAQAAAASWSNGFATWRITGGISPAPSTYWSTRRSQPGDSRRQRARPNG